jgi:oligopeptidase B
MKINPPIATKIPVVHHKHGHQRIDNYYWLNQRDSQEVIDYLEAENAYTDEVMNDTNDLQQLLYDEMVGRVRQTDMSVPVEYNGYSYYTRYQEGQEYPVICRKALIKDASEEIMLDGNKMAEGLAFFHVGSWEVSSDNRLMAYTIDTVSRRQYTLHVKNLETGEVLLDDIQNISGDVTWANDNKTLFYSKKDETLRPFQIMRHVLGESEQSDTIVFEENDPTFNTFVFKTKSDKYLVIGSESTLSSEYWILEAHRPMEAFRVFQSRQDKMEYSIDHQGGRFLVLTNLEAINFRLMETPEENTSIKHWTELVPHRDDVLLESMDVFQDFLVLSERQDGLARFRICHPQTGQHHYVDFEESDYFAVTASNPDYFSQKLRYQYTSLKTPVTVYDYHMAIHEHTMLKKMEVNGGYDASGYLTQRLYATAQDGVKIPISIVYKKGFKRDGNQPVLLYGYGSYGICIDSTFRSSRLSLLDRGFAYAVAHIRGGEELGRNWYEDGKLLRKMNTFTDFIACAQYLVAADYTRHDRMFAYGGSAGGLLMGAVINMEPQLFKGVIAAVPFVDVVTTMLDDSIPLTTGEYDEWGNPNEKVYYDYMLSYSPYDQVSRQDYPALLVTTGLHDSQVQYWEPAKWVAKLRELKTDKNLLLLKTNMEFGHGGASGRFEALKDAALEYAFMLKLLSKQQ